ncbi:MAG: transketolase C-terminal domain-containing protein [Candidatus Levyibacteriota bacterium]
MLNPYLKLNPKIFDSDVEKKATRDGYGAGIVELGTQNKDVVALTGDLSESTRTDEFAKKFPKRFFEAGVAEQNMAAVAAGLAKEGKIPFISSYATFSPGKNWETIRTTIIYNQANVKIAGHHAGIMTGPDGATHQATEDIAITRPWPGIRVFVPCDAIEARKATVEAGKLNGPVYLRFSRDKSPIITTEQTPFELGRVQTFWTSENPQVSIFATGYILYYALLAAVELEEEGIQTLVLNVATIKPADEKGITSAVKATGCAVTVEDHQVAGGLGGLIAEILAKNMPTPIEFIGLQDTFAESGTPSELIEKYGLDKDSIKAAVKKVISRK